MEEQFFERGQRILCPEGEGIVIQCVEDEVKVKLDTEELRKYKTHQLGNTHNTNENPVN